MRILFLLMFVGVLGASQALAVATVVPNGNNKAVEQLDKKIAQKIYQSKWKDLSPEENARIAAIMNGAPSIVGPSIIKEVRNRENMENARRNPVAAQPSSPPQEQVVPQPPKGSGIAVSREELIRLEAMDKGIARKIYASKWSSLTPEENKRIEVIKGEQDGHPSTMFAASIKKEAIGRENAMKNRRASGDNTMLMGRAFP